MSVDLDGLDGRNPMAYFATIGTLLAADRMAPHARLTLAWRNGALPRPVLHGIDDLDELVQLLDEDRREWADAVALTFEGAEDVKYDAGTQRRYLLACREAQDGGRSAALASALVAEGVFAGKGDGKPSDLHFSAGQQRFLVTARELRSGVTSEDLTECLAGPWTYSRQLKSFGWDVSDDRIYALSAANPSKEVKFTVPGADWLGLMGLAAFPVVSNRGAASPAGVSGTWKRGRFTWGLWSQPLDAASVVALIGAGWAERVRRSRLGFFRQYGCAIRRSEQGGYGSFGPSSVEWSDE